MRFQHSLRAAALLAGVGCLLSAATQAAPVKSDAPVTNAVPTELTIPKSVFVIPTSKDEGRDPFFPKSDRMLGGEPVKPTGPAPTQEVTLVLNGMDGQKYAMINGRTLAPGEASDVVTPGGHLRVRLIEIRKDSVIVEAAGQRRELRLRQGR